MSSHDFSGRGQVEVLVDVVKDPEGEWRVLLQLPDAYLLVWGEDARTLAGSLVRAAEVVEARASAPGT